jgi:hypothetical protein
MKKVIFTAIAMIAFSGASMASTKEESKVPVAEEETTRCQDAAIDYYEAVMAQNGGGDDIRFLNQLLSRCK